LLVLLVRVIAVCDGTGGVRRGPALGRTPRTFRPYSADLMSCSQPGRCGAVGRKGVARRIHSSVTRSSQVGLTAKYGSMCAIYSPASTRTDPTTAAGARVRRRLEA
jgi:hypothetical protein